MSAAVYPLDPLRDSRHRSARSARDVEDWLAWLRLGNAAPRTLDAYERTLAALLVAFPDHAIADFTDGDLSHFLLTFPEKSRRIRKAHLSSFFKWGRQSKRIESNPLDMLRPIKANPQAVIEVFTTAETAALCALPSPDGHLMRLLLEAGLRASEACNITMRRIDFDRQRVIVKEGAKGSKDRTVPMTEALAASMANLELLEGLNPEDYLWYDKPGGSLAPRVRRSKAISYESFFRWWKRSLVRAGVDYRKPHTTRHSYATRMQSLGVPMEELSQILGHASISTTADLYVHTKTDAIGERIRALIAAEEA